jgi:hypothetical protein
MTTKAQSEMEGFLSVTRIVALVWALIGAIIALVGLLNFFFGLFFLHFSGSAVFLFFYGALWMLTSIFIHTRAQSWISLAESGQYSVLRERILLWVVLGILFGVICGVLLLIVYLQTDMAESSGSAPLPPPPPPPPTS